MVNSVMLVALFVLAVVALPVCTALVILNEAVQLLRGKPVPREESIFSPTYGYYLRKLF